MDQISSQIQNPAPNPPSLGMSSLVLIGAIFILFVSMAGVGIYLYMMPNNPDTPQISSSIQEEYDAVMDQDQLDWKPESDIDKDLSLLSDEEVFVEESSPLDAQQGLTLEQFCEEQTRKHRDDYCDDDGDGVTNSFEVYLLESDPSVPDTDGDGFKDGEEYYGGYNPNGEGKFNQPVCEEGDDDQKCIRYRVMFIDEDESQCGLITDAIMRKECEPAIQRNRALRKQWEAVNLRDESICNEISAYLLDESRAITNCKVRVKVAKAVTTLYPQNCISIDFSEDYIYDITSCVARIGVISGDSTVCDIFSEQDSKEQCEKTLATMSKV